MEQKLLTKKHNKITYLQNKFSYKDIIKGIINEQIMLVDYDKKNKILYFKAPKEKKENSYRLTNCSFVGENAYFYQEYINFNCLLYDIARLSRDLITRYLVSEFRKIEDATYTNQEKY